MMENIGKFYINGQWVTPDSSDTHTLINPATEAVTSQIPMAFETDVNRAVAAAKAAFDDFSMTSKEERLALLKRLLSL